MTIGLEITNAAGVTELAVGDRITRILGKVTITGGVGGSVVDGAFTSGTAFWWVAKFASSAFFATEPVISVSGSTLTWSWPAGGAGTFNLTYGVY